MTDIQEVKRERPLASDSDSVLPLANAAHGAKRAKLKNDARGWGLMMRDVGVNDARGWGSAPAPAPASAPAPAPRHRHRFEVVGDSQQFLRLPPYDFEFTTY